MRVADYIIKRLNEEGIKHLFMVTGRGILYLSDAAKKNEQIECVSVHHEQGGGYAAMAYSQYNEKLGACLVSTGCGATNVITPVLCAWQDEIPLVIISGQNFLKETTNYTKLPVRTYGQQEANITELVKPITKYAVMINDENKIALEMDKAIYEATSFRKGPVWIDVPLDIQDKRIEEDNLERYTPPIVDFSISQENINTIANALNKAKRPLILFGSAIRSSGSIELLKKFVEKNEYPVVYTNSSVDVYNTNNKLSMGAIGTMAANRAANFAVQNADFILVLGNRLTSMATGNNPDKFAREASIYVIDIDLNEHSKSNIKYDKKFKADVKDFLIKIQDINLNKTPKEWQEKCLEWKKIFPKCEEIYTNSEKVDLYELAKVLSDKISKDDIIITDAGLEELIIPTNMTFKDRQRCLHPVNQGAMGYALPASTGAVLASNKNTVVITGDGSIMMNLQELQTISHNKLPIKIIIINNNCYAVIRKRQMDLFRTRTVGTDNSNGISCPDFEKVAKCFNLKYMKINTTNELTTSIEKLLTITEPVICEIMGKENQKYLHSSYRKNSKGKIVFPPIEDQSPFLDRELFSSQMIIKTTDD